jgi:type IV pilus assembly protein PilC
MLFYYRAKNMEGGAVEGKLQAQTIEHVVQQLHQQKLIPVHIREDKAKEGKSSLWEHLKLLSTVSLRDKAVFFRQLSTMTKAGVPLGSALEVLSQQTANAPLGSTLVEVKGLIDGGHPFHETLSMGKIFSPLMVAMVKAGEEGGVLDESLGRLASFLEWQDALHKKIVSSLTYPAFVLCFALFVAYFTIAFIVPRFAVILGGLSVPLPVITRVLFSVSLWLQEHWYVPAFAVLGAGAALYFVSKSASARPVLDKIKLRLPIVGDILHKIALTRSLRTLSSLVEAGVPILQALDMTAGVTGNALFSSAFKALSEAARRGGSLGEEASRVKAFPIMASHMISVGEQTGRLEEMLGKAADLVEVELDEKVKRLTFVLEPILLIFVGGAVGIIVLSIYLPIVTTIRAMM